MNDTEIWQACPAASVALTHVELEATKSAGLAPPKVEPETIRAEVPEFVTETTWEALEVPTICAGYVRLSGAIVPTGGGDDDAPVPVRIKTVLGSGGVCSGASELRVIDNERPPVPCGVNVTVN
jgi:hypothetical protein